MYQKMLVPLDGSELAEKVLPYALQLTGRLRLETILLHICHPAESPSLFMCRAYIERVAEIARLKLENNKDRTAPAQGKSAGVIRGETITGDIPGSILTYAEDMRADLILISRHGHSGIGRWLTGSVAHKVLSASRIPVLVIHPGSTESTVHSEWPRTVLALMDGSSLSETVLSHIETLFKQGRFDGEVTLFQVCEPPDLLSDYPEAIMPLSWSEHVSRAKAASERVCSVHLNEVKKLLEAKGIRVRIEVALGEKVIDEIIQYIREHPFDLVAMTTHGRSGISEWPYGHVADRIVQAVPVPLFVVRPLEQQTRNK